MLLLGAGCAAECHPMTEAPKLIGGTVCITGTVVKVSQSQRSGTHFLNFCADYRECPFSVVVFPRDLANVGDVRWLEGKVVEITGRVKEYKGKAEIVLNDVRQLSGGAAKLPLLPKNYDVERRGNYSEGTFSTAKPKRSKAKRRRGGTDSSAGEAEPTDPQQ